MLSFSHSPEGLIELSKLLTLTVTVYPSERIQTKISNGKGHKGGILETPDTRFQLSFSGESCIQCLILPAMMCDNTYGVSLTRNSESLSVQGFYWGLGIQVCLTAHTADLSPQTSRDQANAMWPKAPSIKHVTGMNYLAGSRPPGKERHSYRQTFQEIRGYL